MSAANVDPAELEKFGRLAAQWWDPDGPMAPLHAINPLRLAFVERTLDLDGLTALDVGCGGGLFSEALAGAGATVTGIDLTADALKVAAEHADAGGLDIDYREIAVEALAAEQPGHYDLVSCLEMLEHVPEPGSVIAACAALLKPGGTLILSTLNRNPKAFAHAIVGAEYLLGLVPRGTHEYARFIRPSELARWCRDTGLDVKDLAGLGYNPLTRLYSLNDNVDVNYLMRVERPC